jgi:hypothetical protein
MKRLITAAQESVRGTKRTNSADVMMSVVRGRPEVGFLDGQDRF